MDAFQRFKAAQDDASAGFETALAELRAGRKTSHWIWYVFPQLAGLGHSATAQFYALRDLAEACDYLRDSRLRNRLSQAAEAVAEQLARGIPLDELMGSSIDALKLVSSITLFRHAASTLAGSEPSLELARLAELSEEILVAAEFQGFARCRHTLAHCGRPN